jgi:predicted amidohydrolase YtcJ
MLPGVPGDVNEGVLVPLARVHAAVARRAPAGADSNEIGVLAAGLPASLMLVDRDITRMTAAEVEGARVMLVMSGGRVVHDPGSLLR